MIVIPLNFRGITSVGIVMMIITIAHIQLNSKEKYEYENIEGRITYLEKEMGTLPSRDKGFYRYLIIDTYPFPFELYIDETASVFDSLRPGDNITVFYYETNDTKSSQLNRFAQFIEKDGKTYLKPREFQKTIGYIILGFSLILVSSSYFLWKAKKIIF